MRIGVLALACAASATALAEDGMPEPTTVFIDAFGGLKYLTLWLLFINVLLTAGVILFAFRSAILKEKVDELEAELGRSVSDALNNPLSDDRPIAPMPARRKRMPWRG